MPSRKPWSRSTSTDTTWLLNRSSRAMSAGLPASLAGAPSPSSLPPAAVSVAEGTVTVLGGGRVGGDRVAAARARLDESRGDGVAIRRDRDAGVAGGDRVVDRGDLSGGVTVGRTGRDGQVDAALGRVGLRALLHRD